ncbi:MAG TPA: outer membrane protein transport protein [Kofleriaceae bacterium]|nr:outer membrane protein transport protein [Kofleriaceae bacterium]
MRAPRLRSVLAGATALFCAPAFAHAGGLVVPGSGPVSTGRAGAAVASIDDPAAIGINPAGLAKTKGTVVHVGSALINYSQTVTRTGVYEADNDQPAALPWEGQPYGAVSDSSKPAIGLGPFQAVPVIAVSSDLGGKVKGLTVAAGVFAPNAYPVRNMDGDYVLEDPNRPPPPTRYDTMEQKAAVVLPSIAAAYRISDKLDVGGRFSWGFADVEARTYVWGLLNYSEWAGKDGEFRVKVKDNFIPAFGLGATFRPSDSIEVGAAWQSIVNVAAKGTGGSTTGSGTGIGGNPVTVIPVDGLADNLCEAGGTADALKACVNLSLPMMATLGGRYIMRGDDGRQKADVELNVQWENWSGSSDYQVIVDGFAAVDVQTGAGLRLNPTFIRHNLKDTFSVRLGGSYSLPVGKNELTLRTGIAHDTAAAKEGWQRADFDGAARWTAALGASFAFGSWRVDAGGGIVYEGSRSQGQACNPATTSEGCGPNGERLGIDERVGPDPSQPTSDAGGQVESPYTHGTIESGYVMLLLGVTKHF